MVDRYFIKDGYVANEKLLTSDAVSGKTYWNKRRIRQAYHYQFAVYRYVSDLVRAKNVRTLIDVGCGVAVKLRHVHERNPHVRIIGIDQESAIAYCREHHKFGEWHLDDLENPRHELKHIVGDLVLAPDVIEHLHDPDTLLAYLKRRVAPSGYLVLSTPERASLRGSDCNRCPSKYHIREWNFSEFERYLADRGFEVLEHVMQYPVKFALNKTFYNEIARRFVSGRPTKYNQVCLMRVKAC